MAFRRKVKQTVGSNSFIVGRKIRNSYRVKLAGLEVCEKSPHLKKTAAEKLNNLISGKTVTIVPVDVSGDVKSNKTK